MKEITVPKKPLTDAALMAYNYPKTFQCPDKKELDNLKVGDLIKVCAAPERFWVQVETIGKRGKLFICRVDNKLGETDIHGLKENDRIEVNYYNIYSIYDVPNNQI